MRYRIVYERARGNFSAYSPDLPGCVTVGDTIEETRRNMYEAIEFHLEGLAEDGQRLPKPTEYVEYVPASAVKPRWGARRIRKVRPKGARAARA